MESTRAREYSDDGVRWSTFPDGMGPVTGQMDRTAAALVLADLTIEVRGAIDLWQYADWSNASGVGAIFALGVSTICCGASRHFRCLVPDEVPVPGGDRSRPSCRAVLRVGQVGR